MESDAHSETGNSQKKAPANENEGVEMEDAGLSQNGEGQPTGKPTPEVPNREELPWSLLGLGADGEQLPSDEKVSHENLLNKEISENVSSLVGELDSDTRRALREIDTYASASVLAQERTALMGRAEDLTMDLRDMQEQIREMETSAANLRSALQEAYRRPGIALRAWGRLEAGTRGAGSGSNQKASQILVAAPERLGALRGTSVFGFSTPARSEAVRAAARAAGQARAYQDAARRATRLGVFGGDKTRGRRSEKREHRTDEKETGRYPGLSQKRDEIIATRKEAGVLAEKVQEITGGRPLSKQSRAVTERVRSLNPEQRQALRKVILRAGGQSVDEANREAGRGAASRRKATARGSGGDRTSASRTPALKRSVTARSTIRRGQSAKQAPSKGATAKGILKASLRHVAIHVAIRTLDRVEKESRGREMLEI